MWATIISAIASIAAASISAGVKSSQMRQASAEAKNITGMQRKDDLTQLGVNNRLAKTRLSLTDKQLKQDESMVNANIADTTKNEQYLKNTTNQKALTQSATKLLKPDEESWLYKGRMLGRY